jgi:hypothetical protein
MVIVVHDARHSLTRLLDERTEFDGGGLAQFAWLCDAGCDVVQGFLTGRPMSVADICQSMLTNDDETVVEPLSNLEWVDCRVKCGRKPGEANT